MAAQPILPIAKPFIAPVIELFPGAFTLPAGLPLMAGDQIKIEKDGYATWEEAFDAARAKAQERSHPSPKPVDVVTAAEVQKAIDTTAGEIFKVLSGYLNQAFNYATNLANVLQAQVDELHDFATDFAQDTFRTLQEQHATQQAIVQLALPNIQAQILNLKHDTAQGFQYNSAADRAWATDNIFRPLYESMFAARAQTVTDIKNESDRLHRKVNDEQAVAHQSIRADILPVASAVSALQQFKDECAQPMCETMGPKTDLGKALKALNTAATAALLLQLASMSRGDIENLIESITGRAGGILDVLGDLFVGGLGDLGGTLAEAGAG